MEGESSNESGGDARQSENQAGTPAPGRPPRGRIFEILEILQELEHLWGALDGIASITTQEAAGVLYRIIVRLGEAEGLAFYPPCTEVLTGDAQTESDIDNFILSLGLSLGEM